MNDSEHDLAEIQEDINRYAKADTDDPDAYLEYYIKAHSEISAEEVAIRAKSDHIIAEVERETDAMLGDLNNRRKGLDWNHKEPIIAILSAKVEGKKARHIKTLHGRVGFRKKAARQTLNIFDGAALERDHPEFFVQQARTLNKSMLMNALKGGAVFRNIAWLDTVPGEDNFYVDTGKPQLAAQKKLPEKGGE